MVVLIYWAHHRRILVWLQVKIARREQAGHSRSSSQTREACAPDDKVIRFGGVVVSLVLLRFCVNKVGLVQPNEGVLQTKRCYARQSRYIIMNTSAHDEKQLCINTLSLFFRRKAIVHSNLGTL
jgi:hypothetical protein